MAFTWKSNIVGLDKSHFLMNIKGLYLCSSAEAVSVIARDCDRTRSVQKVNSPWPDTEIQTHRETASTIHQSLCSNSMKKRRHGIFSSSQNVSCAWCNSFTLWWCTV